MLMIGTVAASSNALAYPTSERVLDAPGGEVIGVVRAGDVVKVLRTKTIRRSGQRQRWAYIEYGDAQSFGRGWVNLKTFKLPEPPYPGDESGTESGHPEGQSAPIWDIDIDCRDGRAGSIRACRLTMKVDLDAQILAEAYESRLTCEAELHWTTPDGEKRVAKRRDSKYLVLSDHKRRPSLDLQFDFDYPGASNVMVENQACRLP